MIIDYGRHVINWGTFHILIKNGDKYSLCGFLCKNGYSLLQLFSIDGRGFHKMGPNM